jgi:hypothetical protein
MQAQCGCGTDEQTFAHSLGCLDCGSACCPECAISLESVTYCQTCAAALLDADTVRASATFELH